MSIEICDWRELMSHPTFPDIESNAGEVDYVLHQGLSGHYPDAVVLETTERRVVWLRWVLFVTERRTQQSSVANRARGVFQDDAARR